jgi:hypothetical protein
VLISKDENQITFKGSGRFSILDSLMINANDSTATFKQSKLKFIRPDSSQPASTFLPQGETPQTIYVFRGPINLTGLLPITDKYDLIIARISSSGKTYLYLQTTGKFDLQSPFGHFYSIIFD